MDNLYGEQHEEQHREARMLLEGFLSSGGLSTIERRLLGRLTRAREAGLSARARVATGERPGGSSLMV